MIGMMGCLRGKMMRNTTFLFILFATIQSVRAWLSTFDLGNVQYSLTLATAPLKVAPDSSSSYDGVEVEVLRQPPPAGRMRISNLEGSEEDGGYAFPRKKAGSLTDPAQLLAAGLIGSVAASWASAPLFDGSGLEPFVAISGGLLLANAALTDATGLAGAAARSAGGLAVDAARAAQGTAITVAGSRSARSFGDWLTTGGVADTAAAIVEAGSAAGQAAGEAFALVDRAQWSGEADAQRRRAAFLEGRLAAAELTLEERTEKLRVYGREQVEQQNAVGALRLELEAERRDKDEALAALRKAEAAAAAAEEEAGAAASAAGAAKAQTEVVQRKLEASQALLATKEEEIAGINLVVKNLKQKLKNVTEDLQRKVQELGLATNKINVLETTHQLDLANRARLLEGERRAAAAARAEAAAQALLARRSSARVAALERELLALRTGVGAETIAFVQLVQDWSRRKRARGDGAAADDRPPGSLF